MKLTVTATSFVIPGNQGWRSITDTNDVSFGEYGDWPTALRDRASEALLWVIFLNDVAHVDALHEQDDVSASMALLEPMIQALHGRLSASNAPTIVAWSGWHKETSIRQAKQPTKWRQLCNQFAITLENLATEYPGLYLIEMDNLFAETGLDACFDTRNYYYAHCRLSVKGLSIITQAVAAIIERITTSAKKILVLDCDNTLWGGVVGEVGVSGITLGQDGIGQAFVDFQLAAQRLGREGILLAIASKNNEEDVWEVFSKHSAMVLKKEDITTWYINWQDKAGNIKAMAEDLDLGIDSFVFWDDNPLEREKVRAQLPQLFVPEIPDNVMLWPQILSAMDAFASFSVTSEDRKKTEQYRSRSAFVLGQRTDVDETEFLKSIALEPRAIPIDNGTLGRAAQLCMKTNQFNLRTIRHTETELADIVKKPETIAFIVHLKDKFGDHGNVGLLIAQMNIAPKVAFLDTFLISCRVLGRHLESWMLWMLKEQLKQHGIEWLLAERLPTTKNVAAKDFLSGHGMIALEEYRDIVPCSLMEAANRFCTGEIFLVSIDQWKIPNLGVYKNV